MRLRRFFSRIFCMLVTAAPLAVAAEQDPATRLRTHWDVQCPDQFCTMTHLLAGEHNGKTYFAAAGLRFDGKTGKPTHLMVQLPPDADRDAGVEVAFFDPPDAPNRRKTQVFTLALGPCDETSCAAEVSSDPTKIDRDLQINIVENALRYSILGVGYQAGGERTAALESTAQFKLDYQTLLADLKKPQ